MGVWKVIHPSGVDSKLDVCAVALPEQIVATAPQRRICLSNLIKIIDTRLRCNERKLLENGVFGKNKP